MSIKGVQDIAVDPESIQRMQMNDTEAVESITRIKYPLIRVNIQDPKLLYIVTNMLNIKG